MKYENSRSYHLSEGLLCYDINPRLIRGVLQPHRVFFLTMHKNEKATDPGLLSNLFYIFCAHFEENNLGVPPEVGVW